MIWSCYSKKLVQKIESPRHSGFFSAEEAKDRGMRLAVGKQEGVSLYLLVDESDGVIADAKFQVFGPSALIGAAESACEILIRKNYDQAMRLTANLIERHLRDKAEIPAFPEESNGYLNRVVDAIEQAAQQCLDIPFAENYVQTPLEAIGGSTEGYPGWNLLSREQKIAAIEEIIAVDIRPYIELDAGGIHIVDFIDNKQLIIAYEGACTTCYSSTGSTLNAIQEILRAKVDPHLQVVPDASFLSQG